MSLYLNPIGRSTYGIGICARCSRKFYLDQLDEDPNAPGLLVCSADKDQLDPYRLPARVSENTALEYTRPDSSLTGVEAAFTLDGPIRVTESGEIRDTEDTRVRILSEST